MEEYLSFTAHNCQQVSSTVLYHAEKLNLEPGTLNSDVCTFIIERKLTPLLLLT